MRIIESDILFYVLPFLVYCLFPVSITDMEFTKPKSDFNPIVEKENEQLSWYLEFPGLGSLSSPRATDLNNDGILDIIVGMGREEFQWADPNGDGYEDIIASSVDGTVYAFDGKSKKQLWKVNIPGTEIYSSPAIGHFTKDDFLDVFVTANKGFWPFFSECTHVMIDGAKGKIRYNKTFGDFQSCSPLDIAFCHSNNQHHTFAYDGMQINLLKTGIELTKPIRWGAYMGSDYNGRY